MKETIEEALKDSTAAKWIIIAGAVGGLLSLNFVEGMSLKQKLVALPTAATMAYFLAPLIAYLSDKNDYQVPIGFLIGLYGMSICRAIFKDIENGEGLLTRLFDRFIGKKE